MKFRRTVFTRTISVVLAAGMVGSSSPARVFAQPAGVLEERLPGQTPPFFLSAVRVYPEEPFRFEFMLDGDSAGLEPASVAPEAQRLIDYFFAALTVPDKDLWVNLSPDEPDRVIPAEFGRTRMGMDFLRQDYVLKRFTAGLAAPDTDTGRLLWERLDQLFAELRPGEELTDLVSRVWIVADRALIHEFPEGAAVEDVGLRVEYDLRDESDSRVERIVSEVFLPELERAVNEDPEFLTLRQMMTSFALASWYKTRLRETLLSRMYVDRGKTAGVEDGDSTPADVVESYLRNFRDGALTRVMEEYSPGEQRLRTRRYVSGGLQVDPAMFTIESFPRGWTERIRTLLTVSVAALCVGCASVNGLPAENILDMDLPAGTVSEAPSRARPGEGEETSSAVFVSEGDARIVSPTSPGETPLSSLEQSWNRQRVFELAPLSATDYQLMAFLRKIQDTYFPEQSALVEQFQEFVLEQDAGAYLEHAANAAGIFSWNRGLIEPVIQEAMERTVRQFEEAGSQSPEVFLTPRRLAQNAVLARAEQGGGVLPLFKEDLQSSLEEFRDWMLEEFDLLLHEAGGGEMPVEDVRDAVNAIADRVRLMQSLLPRTERGELGKIMNTLMLVFQTDRGAVSDGETFLFPELSELFWDGGGDSVPRLTGLTYPDGKGLPLAREIVRTSQKWERAYKYMFRDDRLALQILRGREQEQVYLLLEALNERHQSGQLLEGLEALGEAARSGLTLPYSGEETVRAALALLAGQDGTTPDSAREWLRDVIDREDTAGAWTALFFAGRQAFDALAREWDRRGVDEVFRQQAPASFAAGEESDAATLAAWAAEDIGGIRFDVDLMTFDYRGRPFSFKIPAGSTFFNTVTVDGFRPVILDIRIR